MCLPFQKNVSEQGEQFYLQLLRTKWTEEKFKKFKNALKNSENVKAFKLLDKKFRF